MAESQSAQNLLAANWGARRVTIGLETPDDLRRWSDAREMSCPVCGGTVVLHAGTVRAHHFAHLPGALCHMPQSEPETEEHRAGKLLLARWLRAKLPDAEVIVEAWLPETEQRADLLLQTLEPGRTPRRVALELQCANLSAREWRRRHGLYRGAGIEDLWLLGGSRLHHTASKAPGSVLLRTTELERALFWDGAPLLFLDAVGERLPAETLARFRPDADAQAARPVGKLSARPLIDLDFPWPLLAWPQSAHATAPTRIAPSTSAIRNPEVTMDRSYWLREWLAQRFRVTPETLAPFFGLPVTGQEVFDCEARLWQAALYYRFVHQRVGGGWWLREVTTFARAYLPLAKPLSPRKLDTALAGYQELLAAAGLLSLPMGYGRTSATVTADLTTLSTPPDRDEILRLARYRRTLLRETVAIESSVES